MNAESPRPAASYEVALAGSIGPAFRAALGTAAPHRSITTSHFLLPASSGADLCEVVAMLQARGLTVLDVRQVPARTVSPLDEPGDAPGSSTQGDVPGQPRRGPWLSQGAPGRTDET